MNFLCTERRSPPEKKKKNLSHIQPVLRNQLNEYLGVSTSKYTVSSITARTMNGKIRHTPTNQYGKTTV